MSKPRKSYHSDVSDDEWAFLAPFLTLMRPDAPQRAYPLRELPDGARSVVKTGCQWRMLPHDFPPWEAVYRQTRRGIGAGRFEAMAHTLRELVRAASGKAPTPSAAAIDGRTVPSTPASGGPARAGYDGHKKKKGSKVHMAVDTLGLLLAVRVTPANAQERRQVFELCKGVQGATGRSVTVAFVDQGYPGAQPAADAAAHGIELCVVKLKAGAGSFALVPKRWVVERSFAWMARFRRLARDYERTKEVLEGWHWLAFAGLMIRRLVPVAETSA